MPNLGRNLSRNNTHRQCPMTHRRKIRNGRNKHPRHKRPADPYARDRLLQMVEASLLRNRTHRCSAHHADNAPASPGKTSKMNKIAPAPRASTLNSLRGCRSRHWQTTLHPCADQKHASCRLERMRFAGWSLRLDRCNSCLPLDTELHKMTRHQRVLSQEEQSQEEESRTRTRTHIADGSKRCCCKILRLPNPHCEGKLTPDLARSHCNNMLSSWT